MRRITGTHVYTYPKCARAVALDFHGDRDDRRPVTEVEEFVLKRGRDLEDRLCADLDYAEPQYPERDFEAGAAATHALLREGPPGVLQAVLLEEDRLGIPDLLRREEGASELGDFHYVVGDIKSSRLARGDQILQTMFYSRLLKRLQGREPGYAYLILRDGHEERFALADYEAAIDEVEQRIVSLRSGDTQAEAFYGYACDSCRWSQVCLPQLEERNDLSLVQGMTRGLREVLGVAGVTDVDGLRGISVETVAKRTRLESALLRRLKKAAESRAMGRPLRDRRPAAIDPCQVAVVHMLSDPFADRIHWFGALYPATADGTVHEVFVEKRERELSAFLGLVERLPAKAPIWHYGEALPRWFEEAGWSRRTPAGLEARTVDLARRLRGVAVYPGPVFGLGSHVKYSLGRDPHRAGDARAVGMWVEHEVEDAADRLSAKGRSDLGDLAALIEELTTGGEGGSDT